MVVVAGCGSRVGAEKKKELVWVGRVEVGGARYGDHRGMIGNMGVC
jgi:hypothetical protein